MRGPDAALWYVAERSPCIAHVDVLELEAAHIARVGVVEMLKGALPSTGEIVVSAAEPRPPHVDPPDWQAGHEAVVALAAGPAPPYRPLGPNGVRSLAVEGEAKLATYRDMLRLVAAPDTPPDEGARALVTLLERPLGFSALAGLEALRELPRAAGFVTPEVEATVLVLLGCPDETTRRDAAWACERLGPGGAVLDALIGRLRDEGTWVRYAAGETLKVLTGEDLGFDAEGTADRRAIAMARWRRWREASSRPG